MAERQKETQAGLGPNPVLPLPHSSPHCPGPVTGGQRWQGAWSCQVQTSRLTVSTSCSHKGQSDERGDPRRSWAEGPWPPGSGAADGRVEGVAVGPASPRTAALGTRDPSEAAAFRLFNNLENVYSSAGRSVSGFRNTKPWGPFPVKSEIPLVTVTENTGLFLEGAPASGVYKHPRRPGGQLPGPRGPRWEPAALPSPAVLRWEPLASTSPFVPCLLGGGRAAGPLCDRGPFSARCLVAPPAPQSHLVSASGRDPGPGPQGCVGTCLGWLVFPRTCQKVFFKKKLHFENILQSAVSQMETDT